MSADIPIELQRQIRSCFADCCAYCRTAEPLTVATFGFEQMVQLSVDFLWISSRSPVSGEVWQTTLRMLYEKPGI